MAASMNWLSLSVGVLIIRALLFGVCTPAPVVWNLPSSHMDPVGFAEVSCDYDRTIDFFPVEHGRRPVSTRCCVDFVVGVCAEATSKEFWPWLMLIPQSLSWRLMRKVGAHADPSDIFISGVFLKPYRASSY